MPTKFNDAAGVERTLALTIGTIEDVKAATGIDLYCPTEPTSDPDRPRSLVGRLHYEPGLVANVVSALMTPTAPDVSEWRREQTAASLSAARAALLTEWEDFFRQLGRDELAEILLAETAFVAELKRQATATAQAADIKAEAARCLAKATSERRTSAEPSGSGLDMSGSTPGP